MEDPDWTWEQFGSLLNSCYEYIKSWKQKENSERMFQKIVSEMLPIVDRAYKKKDGRDIEIVSILLNEAENLLPTLKHLLVDPKLEQFHVKNLEDLFESILHMVDFELKKIEKNADSLHYKYLKELSILLNTKEQHNNILESLKKCRFDKRDYNLFLSHSII